MSDDEVFNVVIFDAKGFSTYVGRDYTAKTAVEAAKRLVDVANDLGKDINRVMITDSGDFTNFLWERDKGIVFPPPREGTA